MIEYRDFQPTGFDPKGLALREQQDWLVAPVTRNRDSGVLAESNWACQLAELKRAPMTDPDGDADYEVHRFGHWACGWFEITIVRPDSPAAKAADELEAALADYPVVDDSDYSERCCEEALRVWSGMRPAERIAYMRRNESEFASIRWADCPWLTLLANARGTEFNGDTIGMAEGC